MEDFSFQDLTLKFHSRRNESAALPGQVTDSQSGVSEISQQQTDEAQLADETSLEEAEQAQMLIDNPHEFERMQIARHIEMNRGRKDDTTLDRRTESTVQRR